MRRSILLAIVGVVCALALPVAAAGDTESNIKIGVWNVDITDSPDMTATHCDTCHTISQAHALDEKTSDATLDAKVAWRGGFAKAAFTSRKLTYGTDYVPMSFQDALHPELQLPLFDNRLQYDNDVGIVPADLWPDIDKDKFRIDADLWAKFWFKSNIWLRLRYRYVDYQDDAPYLYDTSRKYQYAVASVGWLF